jgi:hypothetical protein
MQMKAEIILKWASFLQTLSWHETRLLEQELFTIYTTTGYVTDRYTFYSHDKVRRREAYFIIIAAFICIFM